MELNDVEKRLLFQVEGDSPPKVLTEHYMTTQYTKSPEQWEAAHGVMAKLRSLSDTECMYLIRDIQKNYCLRFGWCSGRTNPACA